MFLLVNALLELSDGLCVFKCSLVELLESFVLLLALLLILEDVLLVGCNGGKNLPLFLEELLFLVVKLLGLLNDVFFLLGETLVDFSFLPLFL